MDKLKNGSVWYISHPDAICDDLAFHALEAGRFSIDNETAPFRCGREHYLLLYSMEGDGEVVFENARVLLPPHTLALIDCKNQYELRSVRQPDNMWTFNWLRFRGRAGDFFHDTILSTDVAAHKVDCPDVVKKTFDHILSIFYQPGPDVTFRLSHDISMLLTIVMELNLSDSPRRNRHQKTINQAAEYIRNNYNKSLDIDQLASQAQLSKYYFIKLFKEFTSIAPYEYVIIYRINEAKKYLLATSLRVSQISEAVGFNDECNFIRTFKRLTGMTPLQYREKQQ